MCGVCMLWVQSRQRQSFANLRIKKAPCKHLLTLLEQAGSIQHSYNIIGDIHKLATRTQSAQTRKPIPLSPSISLYLSLSSRVAITYRPSRLVDDCRSGPSLQNTAPQHNGQNLAHHRPIGGRLRRKGQYAAAP